ncbi:hypothetical protein GCM10023082_01360 [Streptomyces tremellae]|uniref:Uncharacterized protein n=1 Tax=Streptomyces tremellae TaxID=1124239 RepID=A0ABP7DN19_9ACTN
MYVMDGSFGRGTARNRPVLTRGGGARQMCQRQLGSAREPGAPRRAGRGRDPLGDHALDMVARPGALHHRAHPLHAGGGQAAASEQGAQLAPLGRSGAFMGEREECRGPVARDVVGVVLAGGGGLAEQADQAVPQLERLAEGAGRTR